MNAMTQTAIRPATPADAALVVAMLLELATREGTARSAPSTASGWQCKAWQRYYRHLGAT